MAITRFKKATSKKKPNLKNDVLADHPPLTSATTHSKAHALTTDPAFPAPLESNPEPATGTPATAATPTKTKSSKSSSASSWKTRTSTIDSSSSRSSSAKTHGLCMKVRTHSSITTYSPTSPCKRWTQASDFHLSSLNPSLTANRKSCLTSQSMKIIPLRRFRGIWRILSRWIRKLLMMRLGRR